MGMKWETESYNQSQQWVQDWLWLFRQISGMIKVLIFNQAPHCAARYSPLSPLHCAREDLCVLLDERLQHRNIWEPAQELCSAQHEGAFQNILERTPKLWDDERQCCCMARGPWAIFNLYCCYSNDTLGVPAWLKHCFWSVGKTLPDH